MGYMRHHAIVVTSFDKKKIAAAHKQAERLGAHVSNVVEGAVNGYFSFLIAPDGSKEGWGESDDGDQQRESMKEWLCKQEFEDGSSVLDWVEVMFGDDDGEVEIVDDGDYKGRTSSEDSAR